jgi:hypothetical protein
MEKGPEDGCSTASARALVGVASTVGQVVHRTLIRSDTMRSVNPDYA